jgi:hypothetical protein
MTFGARAPCSFSLHIFSKGGHGFGLKHQGTSSDHWIDAFYNWLNAQGFK